MTHIYPLSKFLTFVGCSIALLVSVWILATPAFAESIVFPTCGGDSGVCYTGAGISQGITQAGTISGFSADDPRSVIIEILKKVISYLALAAVVVIVIAGIYLIFSNGNDDAKEKAKKIIFYVIAGMVLIMFASAIVVFVANIVPTT